MLSSEMRGKGQAGVVQYACAQNYMVVILISYVTWIEGIYNRNVTEHVYNSQSI